MTAVARITYAGGGALLPASTPYERQLLHDHLAYLTPRRRSVRLELQGRTWWLTAETAPLDCATCHRQLRISALMRRFAVAARCLSCALGLPHGAPAAVRQQA